MVKNCTVGNCHLPHSLQLKIRSPCPNQVRNCIILVRLKDPQVLGSTTFRASTVGLTTISAYQALARVLGIEADADVHCMEAVSDPCSG